MNKINRDIVYYKTPIGTAEIIGNEKGINSISILNDEIKPSKNIPRSLKDCVDQLDEYFQKKRTTFNLNLNPLGTVFQNNVWKELQKIPYAKTTTYKEQSKKMGDVKAIRAVASANGKNPIWIIIPCHRVVGTDGSLMGYAGELWRKKWLLEHENPPNQTSLF